ncbi:MAG: hypothetical protein ONB42_16800, partial [candidate division KSB1 bacterium]|nr:hypothetical protein [candidate division KSB1 bacterium]
AENFASDAAFVFNCPPLHAMTATEAAVKTVVNARTSFLFILKLAKSIAHVDANSECNASALLQC